MKKDIQQTSVIFRKYKDNGDILALFPYMIENKKYIGSYEHLGQHGNADYNHCINTLTIPATELESRKLKAELESIGYNLKVIKRRNYNTYLKEYYKIIR